MSLNYKHIIVFSLLFFFGLVIPAFSQSKTDLEKKKLELQKDIEYKNSLLKETKKNKQLSLSQLVLLNKQIAVREELIATINREIKLLNKQINENQALIDAMEKDLQNLKDEYAKIIYYSYKNRSAYDKLMFIFSSEDFNQAYKRLKYYQQYEEYRKQQADLIVKTKQIIAKKLEELQIKKAEKQELLSQELKEKNNLAGEKNEKQTIVNQLQQNEKKLKDDIQKKEKEAAKLQQAIQKIIEAEIAKSKEKGKFVMTPEALALSENFTGNKSKLPWPVEKGVVTSKFGIHPHPILKGVEMKNNGIDISTTEGAVARAVFDGVVSKVLIIPGVGKAIMVRHGEYYTIYSNLKESYVKEGDKISTKQTLGLIMTDEDAGKTEIHFEIWKRQEILNPSDWIYLAK
jgi:murein hydrolase activator